MMDVKCRVPLGFILLLMFVTVAVSMAEDGKTADTAFKYYRDGQEIVEDSSIVRTREQTAENWRNQAWRKNAILVAAVEASHLRPPALGVDMPRWQYTTGVDKPRVIITTAEWSAEYDLVEHTTTTATVALHIDDQLRYVFDIQKPYGIGWYITEVRKAAPMGAGPASKRGVQMLPVKDILVENGIDVVWDAVQRAALVKSANVSAQIKPGVNSAVVDGQPLSAIAPPKVSNGVLYAPEDLLSKIIALHLVPHQ